MVRLITLRGDEHAVTLTEGASVWQILLHEALFPFQVSAVPPPPPFLLH